MAAHGSGREGRGTLAELSLSFQSFIDLFPPPQTATVTRGYYSDPGLPDRLEIPKGATLHLLRIEKRYAKLTFTDPWGCSGNLQSVDVKSGIFNDLCVHVTLPVHFPGKFQVLPFDPVSGDTAPDHEYETVADLVEAFPRYVRTGIDHFSSVNSNFSFNRGDRLKLIRLVFKMGMKMLECKHLERGILILLPMNTYGSFTMLQEDRAYTLSELINVMPLRERRLRLSIQTTCKIPGLPTDVDRDLFMEVLPGFVEACPPQNPTMVIGVPINFDVDLAPVDGHKQSTIVSGFPFRSFVEQNREHLPFVIRVTDWEQESLLLEQNDIKPGTELCVWEYTKQPKFLAKVKKQYFAVSLSYRDSFLVRPRVLRGAKAITALLKGTKLKVIKAGVSFSDKDTVGNDYDNITVGDVIQVKGSKSGTNVSINNNIGDYVICSKLYDNSKKSTGKDNVKLFVACKAVFQEYLESSFQGEKTLSELNELMQLKNISNILVFINDSNGHRDASDKMQLPLDEDISLFGPFLEPNAVVSRSNTPGDHINLPLKTAIQVSFVKPLTVEKDAIGVCAKGQCNVEVLSQSDFQEMIAGSAIADEFGINNETDRQKPYTRPRSNSLCEGSRGEKKDGFISKLKRRFSFSKPSGEKADISSTTKEKEAAEIQTTANKIKTKVVNPAAPQAPMVNPAARRAPVVNPAALQAPVKNPAARQAPVVNPAALQGSVKNSAAHQLEVAKPASQQMPVNSSKTVKQKGKQGFSLLPSKPKIPATASVRLDSRGRHLQTASPEQRPNGGSNQNRNEIQTHVYVKPKTSFPGPQLELPPDGNLYNFRIENMASFLSFAGVAPENIHMCIRDKIDGRKFSKMRERDIDRYGLRIPMVLRFYRATHKRVPIFML